MSPARARSARVRRGALRGFTLIELLVALAIVVMALTVALPALTAGSGAEARAAARSVAAAMRLVRSHAIRDNQSREILVDLDARLVTLPGVGRALTLPADVDLSLYTARSEQTGVRRAGIRFFPDGGSTGGRLTLTRGRMAYLVDVDWLTGRVMLHEAPREGS